MAYLQQFLSLHLPSYYLSTLQSQLKSPEFLKATQTNSLFALTYDLLTFHGIGCSLQARRQLFSVMSGQLWIDYNCLRQFRLPVAAVDGAIVRMMKTELGYVYNMMLQLLLRFLGIFLECEDSSTMNNTTLKLVQDIANIHPILKTEISISHPEIDLNQFIQHYLTLLTSPSHSAATIQALEAIKEACHLIGATEKTINSLISRMKREHDNLTKYLTFSPNDSEDESDKLTKVTKESNKTFNEAEIFRKKKPKMVNRQPKLTPLKQTKSMSTIEATPNKANHDLLKESHRSDRKEEKGKNQNGQPLKRTPLFKKIHKHKKPLERTIYHAEIKKFIPKKGSLSSDLFSIKESLCHGMDVFPLMESNKKTQKKVSQMQDDVQEGVSLFCVPETPKVHTFRKSLSKRLL